MSPLTPFPSSSFCLISLYLSLTHTHTFSLLPLSFSIYTYNNHILLCTHTLTNTQREAKKKQVRIWKGYTAPTVPEISSKNFSGKVVEIGNGDNLVVKTSDGVFQKIYFSSLRPPRSVVHDEGVILSIRLCNIAVLRVHHLLLLVV